MVARILHFSSRQRVSHSVVCVALLVLLVAGVASGQQALDAKPKVSETPLTAEQLAVYRAVLSIAFGGDTTCNKQGECMHLSILYGEGGVNLSDQTTAIDHLDAKDCLKNLSIEKKLPLEIHHFRMEDVANLGSMKIRLVDPDQRMKWIHEHNPDDARREGRTAKAVVEDGFERGLTTLSEIQFDESHTHAIVSISYVCGGLCGDGATMLMEKKGDVWARKKECGGWIS
jgi:hypothetical protein